MKSIRTGEGGAAPRRVPALRGGPRLLLVLLACLLGAAAFAQGPAAAPDPHAGLGPTVERDLTGEPSPALFAVGLSTGFPSYQVATLAVSLQAQFVGAQLKAGWTPAGAYLGGQLRAYPPIPIPVPLYAGVGGGIYGKASSYHFALGTHVPLGKNLRLDLEGGVANVPQLDKRAWVPHLAAGISYAIPVELSPGVTPASGVVGAPSAPAAPACAAQAEPDRDQIPGIIAEMVDDWILSALATYGSVYGNLSYEYSISGVRLTGKNAAVSVKYSGSVTEILTGTGHSASGTATVKLVWNGCSWGGGEVEY